MQTLDGYKDYVRRVAELSGGRVVSGADDKTLCRGECVQTFKGCQKCPSYKSFGVKIAHSK